MVVKRMFITAVCVLFLVKLRWPKKKSVYHAGPLRTTPLRTPDYGPPPKWRVFAPLCLYHCFGGRGLIVTTILLNAK